MNIILFGPPGIGKGTQADILSAGMRIPKISSGDILREEAAKGTAVGKTIKNYMVRGELVPDEISMKIVKQRLHQPDCRNGFILDGFPRTIAQAEDVDKTSRIDIVINLYAPKKELIERMAGRLTCKSCGSIFHIKHAPPKTKGVCDKCGGSLYFREDQKAEVVERRIEVYERQTKPLISYYENKGILANVDAKGNKDEVAKNVSKAIGEFRKRKGMT
jgi:adenylate kinase